MALGVEVSDHPIHNVSRSPRYKKQASDSGIILNTTDGKSYSTAFSPAGDIKDDSMSRATDGVGPSGAGPGGQNA